MPKINLRIIVIILLISCSSVPVYLAADTPVAKNPLYLCACFESYTSCDGSAYHLEIDGKVFDNHRGVDWQAKAGTEIFSFGSGTIVFVAYNPCGGYRIVVRPQALLRCNDKRSATCRTQFYDSSIFTAHSDRRALQRQNGSCGNVTRKNSYG